MNKIFRRFSIPIELLFNGSFIFLFSLRAWTNIHHAISLQVQIINKILLVYVNVIPFIFLILLVLNLIGCRSINVFVRNHTFSLLITGALFIVWRQEDFAFWLCLSHLVYSSFFLLQNIQNTRKDKKFLLLEKDKDHYKGKSFFDGFVSTPARMIFFSFALLVLLGAFLLILPISAAPGKKVYFPDALFMSSSAVSTTGLATLSMTDHLSLFGQLVMLFLVQIGALGIMTISSAMALLIGRAISTKEKLILLDQLEVGHLEELLMVLVDIIKYTFFIEIWGWIILSMAFIFEGLDFVNSLYQGLFHSVSAFCTAGFSLFNNSLENYATNPLINFTISTLAILGGLGFIVMRELRLSFKRKRFKFDLSMHSKVTLLSTFLALFGGTVFIFFNEYLHALYSYGLFDKIQIAFFHMMTAMTTAGFNTIPMGHFRNDTLFFLVLVMFVGSAPGSTGGGIKITTVAILLMAIKGGLQKKFKVEIFNRKIPNSLLVKAIAITVLSAILTGLIIYLLMIIEPRQSFLVLVFESVSSFGTVGLSMGVTSELSNVSKIALSFLMFIGRIGPLTLLMAISERKSLESKVEFPSEEIFIG